MRAVRLTDRSVKYLGETPVLTAVREYAAKNSRRFHTPGHKADEAFRAHFPGAELDITELWFSDNLHCPEGAIARAEELAARAWNCSFARFVTSGSTLCVQIMVRAAASEGKKLIIPRASHASVYNACELFGVQPLPLGEEELSARCAGSLLASDPEIAGVLVTSPDYFGKAFSELPALSREVRRRGKLMLCDGAHGAHLGFAPGLPPPPAQFCDLTAVSAHKTLPALTPAALLLGAPRARELAFRAFGLLHTTSPSYPVLASVDYARAYMQAYGGERLLRLREFRQRLETELAGSPVRLPQADDYTKVTADISALNVTVAELREYLESRKVYPEITDRERLLFMLTVCDSESSLAALIRALKGLPERFSPREGGERKREIFPRPRRSMGYLEAVSADREYVELQNLAGRTAAANVVKYPPGTPEVVAGEVISELAAEHLQSHRESLTGLTDGKAAVVKE